MKSRILQKTIRQFILKTGFEHSFFAEKLPRFRRRPALLRHLRRSLEAEQDQYEALAVEYGATRGEVEVRP